MAPPDELPPLGDVALAAMRAHYGPGPLLEADLAAEPFAQFRAWLDDAVAAALPEPNAMVLATSSRDGRPSNRTVLLKELDRTGFVFYTNTGSRKASELTANPAVALCFPWFAMARQVVVEGAAEPVAREVAEQYWATRPRESQLGAWASAQSRTVGGREVLHAQLAAVEQRFAGVAVPLAPHWGGLRVVPSSIEFWQGQPGRMHDRLRFRRAGDAWLLERLQP